LNYTIVHESSVGSTNDEARRLAGEGAAHGLVVQADEQLSGRGRRGREWESPQGNLYLSLLLRPSRSTAEAAGLSLVAAVALGDIVAESLADPGRVSHKWPNDILVDGAKIAGLLLESSGGNVSAPVDWVIVGCGINIASHPTGTPYPATCLNLVAARTEGPETVSSAFLDRFAYWYECWVRGGIGPIRSAWLERAAGLGDQITVRLPGREIEGTFEDMDMTGALILSLPDGGREIVTAGDVFHGTGTD